jgi:CHAD domain-containing protein
LVPEKVENKIGYLWIMPALNLLLRNWNREHRIFLLNLGILKKEINPLAIHDLRVSVKKLRSYLKLYGIILREPGWKSDFIETEKLFSILGKHRDIEMNIRILELHEKENLSEYVLFKGQLHASLKFSSLRIKPAIQEYDAEELKNLAEKIKPDLATLTDESIPVHIEELLQLHLKKINQHAKKIYSEAHDARKLMKDVYYWSGLYPADFFFPAAQKKKLDKILDGLGNWQDHEVLLTNVKHFRQDFVAKKTDEYNDLKHLEKYIKENNQLELGKIKEKIQDFIKDLQGYRRIKKETKTGTVGIDIITSPKQL